MATNSVKSLCLTINKINGYNEDSHGNKYLTLVPTNESKDTIKKYENLWSKIRDLHNSDNYDEKYMKINFNSDDDLPLKKTLEFWNIIICFS